jgi:hypothetical protein
VRKTRDYTSCLDCAEYERMGKAPTWSPGLRNAEDRRFGITRCRCGEPYNPKIGEKPCHD